MKSLCCNITALIALCSAVVSVAWLNSAQANSGANVVLAPTATPGLSACVVTGNKVAHPRTLLLGETTQLSLTLQAECPSQAEAFHVALVLDRGCSMGYRRPECTEPEPRKFEELKRAAREVVAALEPQAAATPPPGGEPPPRTGSSAFSSPNIRVGVVSFNETARVDIPITCFSSPPDGGQRVRHACPEGRDPVAVRRAIDRLHAQGGKAIDAGVDAARQMLEDARNLPEVGGLAVRDFMIVFSDGHNDAGAAPVLQAAGRARKQTTVMSVCVGLDCDRGLMGNVASAPRYAFRGNQPWQVREAVLEEIAAPAATPRAIEIQGVTIIDLLPDNVEFVASDQPVPSVPERGKLVWQIGATDWEYWDGANNDPDDRISRSHLRLSYRVRPLEGGTWPTNRSAFATYRDNLGRAVTFEFPVPEVLVLAASTLPPPTPTPTASWTPSPTHTSTSTRTPTSTPTPAPKLIYLPIGLRQCCNDRHADVVLVLDASSSMARLRTNDGSVRLDAAKAGAMSFVDLLWPRGDKVGVVAFNRRAWVVHRLSSDRRTLKAAIAGIEAAEYTYIDLGLEEALRVLSESQPSRRQAIILLSDGASNPEPADRAVAIAQQAKRAKITIYVIALGNHEWYDPQVLAAVASSAQTLYYSGGDNLRIIYASIAQGLRCSDRFLPWP